jgi:hypothetical protein
MSDKLTDKLRAAVAAYEHGTPERSLADAVALVLVLDNQPACSSEDSVKLATSTRYQLRAALGLEPIVSVTFKETV